MPNRRPVSVRELARVTGFSKATVANALNGAACVAKPTADRITSAAKRLGYRRNPLVGALMSAMRRSQGEALRGVLAIAEIMESDREAHGPFNRQLARGCEERAQALGFSTERFRLRPGELEPERLSGILKSRGVRGLVVLPAWRAPDFTRFDWSAFAGVYTDYLADHSTVSFVCSDHYRSMLDLLELLRHRGYRRPGLVMETERDTRLQSRPRAAVLAFQATHGPGSVATSLLAPRITRAEFTRWRDKQRPDVILSHHHEILDWLREEGVNVPGQMGFASLNQAKADRPCAGLDLRPRLIGECAVELLLAQIERKVWLAPGAPVNTTVPGVFVEGPSLRKTRDTPSSRRQFPNA